jgi:hypothetical protein
MEMVRRDLIGEGRCLFLMEHCPVVCSLFSGFNYRVSDLQV